MGSALFYQVDTFAFAPSQNLTFWLSHFTWAIMTRGNATISSYSVKTLSLREDTVQPKGTECIPVRFSFPCVNSRLEYVYTYGCISVEDKSSFSMHHVAAEHDIRVQAGRHTEVDVVKVKPRKLHLLRAIWFLPGFFTVYVASSSKNTMFCTK